MYGVSVNDIVATTDGGSNVKNAIKIQLGVPHIPCLAHLINNVVEHSVKESGLVEIFRNMNRIIKYFKTSESNTKLEVIQEEEGGKPLKLIQSVSTRWNSGYLMAERFIILFPYVKRILAVQKSSLVVTQGEIEITKDCLPLLKYFLEATERTSGEKYSTCGESVTIVALLKLAVENICPITEIGNSLKVKLVNRMDQHFSEVTSNMFLKKANLLDPRYKGQYLQDKEEVVQLISQELPEKTLSTTAEPINKVIGSIFDHHDEETVEEENCLISYLSEPRTNRTGDPIKKVLGIKNEALRDLALNYLLPPASSVSSERVASALNLTLPSSRGKLTDENINLRLLLLTMPDKYWAKIRK